MRSVDHVGDVPETLKIRIKTFARKLAFGRSIVSMDDAVSCLRSVTMVRRNLPVFHASFVRLSLERTSGIAHRRSLSRSTPRRNPLQSWTIRPCYSFPAMYLSTTTKATTAAITNNATPIIPLPMSGSGDIFSAGYRVEFVYKLSLGFNPVTPFRRSIPILIMDVRIRVTILRDVEDLGPDPLG